jgi:hypothetical protein
MAGVIGFAMYIRVVATVFDEKLGVACSSGPPCHVK